MVFATILGYLAFHQEFSFVDVMVAGLLVYGKPQATNLFTSKNTNVIVPQRRGYI